MSDLEYEDVVDLTEMLMKTVCTPENNRALALAALINLTAKIVAPDDDDDRREIYHAIVDVLRDHVTE
jgi:hypothetical protein